MDTGVVILHHSYCMWMLINVQTVLYFGYNYKPICVNERQSENMCSLMSNIYLWVTTI